jgi:type III restriction enzyme
MQIKFDSQLEYQQKAIDSVINLFLGQEIATSRFGISNNYRPKNNQALLFSNDEIMAVSNNLSIDDDTMLKNLKSVQNSNSLDISNELLAKAFSIEMETGTGKTYIYLRTIFELNKKYGFLKFIIIVPSIAIREGVKSSLKIMK